MTRKDETNNKYGLLTVREYAGTRTGGRGAIWLCDCQCGGTIIARGDALRSGQTKNCGCAHVKPKLPEGESSLNVLILQYKNHAAERGYDWNLTKAQVRELSKQNCHYCGSEPNNVVSRKRANGSYTYNGIDRVNNSKHYTVDNVVTCCKHCNIAKRDRTYDEFITWIHQACKHLNS